MDLRSADIISPPPGLEEAIKTMRTMSPEDAMAFKEAYRSQNKARRSLEISVSGHLEAQAAVFLRWFSHTYNEGHMAINYLDGPCNLCSRHVGRILKEGQRLWVAFPTSAKGVGIGHFRGGEQGFFKNDGCPKG